jgi:hypothetical protein
MGDFMQRRFSTSKNINKSSYSRAKSPRFLSSVLQNLQVQRQFAVRGSPEAEQLDAMQAELLNRLQQDALQFQDLQARLQLRVLQVCAKHAQQKAFHSHKSNNCQLARSWCLHLPKEAGESERVLASAAASAAGAAQSPTP